MAAAAAEVIRFCSLPNEILCYVAGYLQCQFVAGVLMTVYKYFGMNMAAAVKALSGFNKSALTDVDVANIASKYVRLDSIHVANCSI